MNLSLHEEALNSGLVPALRELAQTDDVTILLRVATAFAYLSSQKKATHSSYFAFLPHFLPTLSSLIILFDILYS